jgi:multidrug transporter EmrE-like cation transporter
MSGVPDVAEERLTPWVGLSYCIVSVGHFAESCPDLQAGAGYAIFYRSAIALIGGSRTLVGVLAADSFSLIGDVIDHDVVAKLVE